MSFEISKLKPYICIYTEYPSYFTYPSNFVIQKFTKINWNLN